MRGDAIAKKLFLNWCLYSLGLREEFDPQHEIFLCAFLGKRAEQKWRKN
jgi:hypothetical protein